MLGQPIFDPTAGGRARRIHEVPGRPEPIVDPTDPRYGLPSFSEGPLAGDEPINRDEPRGLESVA